MSVLSPQVKGGRGKGGGGKAPTQEKKELGN